MTPRMFSSSYSWTIPALSWANRRASAVSAGCSFSARSAWATRPTLLGAGVSTIAPIRYVSRRRLTGAARELRTTDRGLVEIARRAGYESEFSSSHAFKHAFGVAPRAYNEPGATSVMADFLVRRR
jgi:AraC-like DNA-binding protein